MPTNFDNKVYEVTSKIPAGRVSTYAEIAGVLGNRAYRAIGTSLSRNPDAPEVPCHRVVKSNGEVGGFMGSKTNNRDKVELLLSEGIHIKDGKIVNFEKVLYKFVD